MGYMLTDISIALFKSFEISKFLEVTFGGLSNRTCRKSLNEEYRFEILSAIVLHVNEYFHILQKYLDCQIFYK